MRKSRVLRKKARRQGVVYLKNGEAFSGIFYEYDDFVLVLVNAAQLDPHSDAGKITADGEIVVLWTDVNYLQFV